ncbi:DUF292 domain protein [Cladophialophora carrionii]|uniref:DUF292 domain protein n=1 Tax=Cladophialophora carrionii TaxID=86049 RepID=A0A1C1CFK6_9EURO|nr:DUF292 domain protein [Cladophialophora carrionii]
MPAASPQTVKLKSTLRLLIPRLRNAQKKDTALSVSARREMAELLAQSREASARIRVENIIHTDITVELMEILELYAELLLARAGLLDVRDKNIKEGMTAHINGGDDDPTTGLEEAAASIIYSAPRLPRDVRELGIVRNMLIDRFGKEFAVRANENQDNCVPARVVDKLKVDPPSAKLVQAYLEEIARTYSVDWPPHRESEQVEALGEEVDGEDRDDDLGGGGGGGARVKEEASKNILADGAAAAPPPPPATPSRPPNKIDIGNLQHATPPTTLEPGGAKSPVSVAPPGPRSDNLSPKVKLPGGGEVGKTNNGGAKSAAAAASTGPVKSKSPASSGGGGGGSAGAVPGKVPTVDDLAKRFSALKR